MRRRQRDQRPEQPFVHGFGQFVQVAVVRRDRRQVEQPEPLQREAGGGVHHPAADRHREQQQVQRGVHRRSGALLPRRRARHRRGAAGVEPPQQPRDGEREEGDADRLCKAYTAILSGPRAMSPISRPTVPCARQQQHDQPVQDRLTAPQCCSGFFKVMAWVPAVSAWMRDRAGPVQPARWGPVRRRRRRRHRRRRRGRRGSPRPRCAAAPRRRSRSARR